MDHEFHTAHISLIMQDAWQINNPMHTKYVNRLFSYFISLSHPTHFFTTIRYKKQCRSSPSVLLQHFPSSILFLLLSFSPQMAQEGNLIAILFSADGYNMGISILACMLISWVLIHRWSQRNKIGPKTWPLVGAAIEQFMNYDRMHDWIVKYLSESKTVVVPMPFTAYTYIADPANVEHVLKTNFANYPKVKDSQQQPYNIVLSCASLSFLETFSRK